MPQLTSPSQGPLAMPYEDRFDLRKTESLRFIVQISLSLIVLALCIGQITYGNKDNKDVAIYWGGITGILAWWMPSPGGSNPKHQADVDVETKELNVAAGNNSPGEKGSSNSSSQHSDNSQQGVKPEGVTS